MTAPVYIVGVDTSCDETSVAVVQDGVRVLSSVIRSQQTIHQQHGGVVPEIASRAHIGDIVPVWQEALRTAGRDLHQVNGIAVTYGPGLGGSLMVGWNMARAVAYARNLPLLPTNHLEGHIYSDWLAAALNGQPAPEFPAVVLIVSGGHTDLLLMPAHGTYRWLGGTRDDAAGEAFDKVGRLLGLPYPGGPSIEQAARDHLRTGGTPISIPRARLAGYDFSFSGIKTAVLRLIEPYLPQGDAVPPELPPELSVGGLAAGFQDSVVESLCRKTGLAIQEYEARSVIVAGGVAANGLLKERMTAQVARLGVPLYMPPIHLCTDNAAMIAAAGYFHLRSRGAALDGGMTMDIDPALGLRG